MSTFSSILSSIGGQTPAPPQRPNGQRPPPKQPPLQSRSSTTGDGAASTSRNAVAGVKRKSEEPETHPRPKTARLEPPGEARGPSAQAPPSRFQLSAKAGVPQKAPGVPHRPQSTPTAPTHPQRPVPKPIPKHNEGTATSTAPVPAKKGFASIMERAKAAQQAASTAGSTTIKHKPAEKLTKRERMRIAEEAKAQQKASKNGELPHRAIATNSSPTKAQETNFKGTMRKVTEPLAYKGTMRAAHAGEAGGEKKRRGEAQDRYGGYASWSDLDDAEDEEDEDGYDSQGSSDMEGGFDEVEREETMAARAARKEDQEALEEEERHRREKMERKRKLMQLSESAKARKKL